MPSRDDILEQLHNVDDPEIGINIVDLGLVYGVDWDQERGSVHVDLTLTSPGCPLGPEIIREIKRALRRLEGVASVDVELVWRPLWHPSKMSEWAKEELGYDEEIGLMYGSY